MTYAFIIALVVAVILGIALYYQIKAGHKQADEQQQLLADYQRRVDEQQKLLEDYRSLEKNFNNVGEGYEQALLAFDKMEEDSQKVKTANAALEKRNADLQQAHTQLAEATQRKEATVQQLVSQLQEAIRPLDDARLTNLVGRLADLGDLDADQPLERTDNVMVTQVAEEAVRQSAIDKAQYIQFQQQAAPDAAATMLHTNLPKAVRALSHLLDNAQKFTTDGSVTLSIAVDMEKMQAYYTVADTGAGIPADDAERVFEPYVRLNQFFDGQGLGLTVARGIARRLGGDVTLEPAAEGEGSRFVLTLPI